MSGKPGIQSRFRPSNRVLELAQHKTTKTAWANTICGKLTWGNQETIWPLSASVLGAVPSARIQSLARHKRDFSVWEDQQRPHHTPQCDNNCPIWHVDPNMKSAAITPRLLQLSKPRLDHPDFQCNRESAVSIVSSASKTARVSQRLVQLSLPRLKQSNPCLALGPLVEPISIVSKAARTATASTRVEMLATPKCLSEA